MAVNKLLHFLNFRNKFKNHTTVSCKNNTVVLSKAVLEYCFFYPTAYLRLPYVWGAVDGLVELGIISFAPPNYDLDSQKLVVRYTHLTIEKDFADA